MSTGLYNLDIISATYAHVDVTTQFRNNYLVNALANPDSNLFVFTPSSAWFGIPDPAFGVLKACVVVWRILLPVQDGDSATADQAYSDFQTSTGIGGTPMSIIYDGSKLVPYTPKVYGDLVLVNATWYTTNITEQVKWENASSGQPPFGVQVPMPPNAQPPFTPPSVSIPTQVSLTLAYQLPNNTLSFTLKTLLVPANSSATNPVWLSVPWTAPPRLTVHAAVWGTYDVTESLRSMVQWDQTLSLDQNNWQSYGWVDPKSGVDKTLSIVYQYGDTTLQCSITNAKTGIFTLSPSDTPQTQYVMSRRAGNTNVVAAVWGIMAGGNTMSQSVFQSIADNGSFPATDAFFAFDGEPGILKSAQVFYQYGLTGPIQCAAGWENDIVTLNQRSLQFSDPFPGRGLLRSDYTSTGFRLQSLESNKYWTVVGGVVMASAADVTTAAIFAYVPATSSNPAVMSVSSSSGSFQGYAFIKGEGFPVQLVPDPGQASMFDYELPGTTANVSLLLSLTPTSGPQGVIIRPTIFAETSKGQIVGASLGTALGNLNSSKFTFEWVPVPTNTLMEEDDLSEDFWDSCLVQSFSMLKLLLWDGLSLLLGVISIKSESAIIKVIGKWWKNLAGPVQTRLSGVMSAIQTALRTIGNPGISEFLVQGFHLVSELFKEGVLWAFFKGILTEWSYWEFALLMANLVKVAFDSTVGVAFKGALLVAELATWIYKVQDGFSGWMKACWPSGTTEAIRRSISLLISLTIPITQTKEFKALDVAERTRAIHALIQPHYERIAAGGVFLPTPPGPSKSLVKFHTTNMTTLTADDLSAPGAQTYLQLSATAKAVVEAASAKLDTALQARATVS